jgi:hypothetical protein
VVVVVVVGEVGHAPRATRCDVGFVRFFFLFLFSGVPQRARPARRGVSQPLWRRRREAAVAAAGKKERNRVREKCGEIHPRSEVAGGTREEEAVQMRCEK